MKTFAGTVILLGLVAITFAQYGIPDDDDDELPPASYEPEQNDHFPAEVSRLRVTPTAVTSYTKYEDEEPLVMQGMNPTFDFRREQQTYSAPAVKTVVEPTRVELREESVHYEQPLRFAVRTENPATTYSSTAERALPSSSASTQIRFADSDNSYTQQGYYSSGTRTENAVPIVKYVMDNDHRGTFRLETVTGDGTSNTETGHLKDLGGVEGPVVVRSGSYRYTGDDGKVYQVDWKADEEGFQAFGDHLPTAPSALY